MTQNKPEHFFERLAAICASCAEITGMNKPSKDYITSGLTFVCEHCHTTNEVQIKVGKIAIPDVFKEAAGR